MKPDARVQCRKGSIGTVPLSSESALERLFAWLAPDAPACGAKPFIVRVFQ